jgi:hypothetical protein
MEQLHFILEHLTFHIETKPVFYGTKLLKIWNGSIYNGTFPIYIGTFNILRSFNKTCFLWNETYKSLERFNLYWNIRCSTLEPNRFFVEQSE